MERYNIKNVEKKWQGIWAKKKKSNTKLGNFVFEWGFQNDDVTIAMGPLLFSDGD